MYKRLSPTEKIRIIKRALLGENIASLCREEQISRTVLYKWANAYKKTGSRGKIKALSAKVVKGRKHWNAIESSTEKQIIKIAIKNPYFSSQKIASVANVSTHGVCNVLKRNGLGTQKDRDMYISKYGISSIKKAVYSDKLNMIARFERGERVQKICSEYAVSRTIFYKWLKRYRQSQRDIVALNDMRPKGEGHWRYVDGVTDTVLGIVATYPEYSINKLTQELRAKSNEKVVGRHGIYNILKRLDLNTYEKRLKYASSQAPVVGAKPQIAQVLLPPQPRYSFLSFLSPPIRNYFFSSFGVSASLCLIVILIPIVLLSSYLPADSFVQRVGLFIAFIALLCGLFFFLYSFKYYLSIAIVLSFSRRGHRKEQGGPSTSLSGTSARTVFSRFFERIFGVSISIENTLSASTSNADHAKVPTNHDNVGVGLHDDLTNVRLERNPFVSVHVSTYNEKRVIDRLLTACTSFDYPNYEVIVADDSNDETVQLLSSWAHNPRVKISHRTSREGYKGGALAQALKVTDPRAEFVLVFDADFIPYQDTIVQFLKYFQRALGSLDLKSLSDVHATASKHVSGGSNIAAVQGYQWHVLNKSENWITRGVRSEYAGSYVIERSGAELYQGLKQISGSVYMIRRDVLQNIGWGTSLTEDFELTLKLYEAGYKVVYTPYIQAPAEAVSTIKRLIRQRMRWAEGHSFNIKRMLIPLLFGRLIENSNTTLDEKSKIKDQKSKIQIKTQNLGQGRIFISSPLTRSEKMELAYLAPYYLQAALFILGTLCWFIAEVIFQVRLPFWTEVWGWSLVATNLMALPLMNMIGKFMEEAEAKDYLGVISFMALTYIVAPFQAYAAVKGFLEKEEGPWFRTPKTGRITDKLMPGRIARFVRGIFGRPQASLSSSMMAHAGNILAYQPVHVEASSILDNPYVALKTSNNRFNSFKIYKVRRIGWVSKAALAILLCFTTSLIYFSKNVEVAQATDWASPFKLSIGAGEGTFPSWGNYLSNTTSYAANGGGTPIRFSNTTANNTTNNYMWYTNLWPTGGTNATIPGGQYYVQLAKSNGGVAAGLINVGVQLLLTNNNGASKTQILWGTGQMNTSAANNSINTINAGNLGATNTITSSAKNRLAVRLIWLNGTLAGTNINIALNRNENRTRLVLPASLSVPEIPKPVIYAIIVAIIPLMPTLAQMLVEGKARRRRKHIFRELADSWINLFIIITGKGEERLDELPV